MTRRAYIMFFALAAFWGASYLFIEWGLEDVSPAVIVFARTALAALVLLPFALRGGALDGVRGRLASVAGLALIQVAAPFMLISVGQEDIASGLAGILVASAPMFTALLAVWVDQAERSHGAALGGLFVGMTGMVILLGFDAGGGTAAVVGGLMVLLASAGYAAGGLWLKRSFTHVQPIGLVTATMGASALMTLPAALATAPSEVPGLQAILGVATLGVVGTGISFVLFYSLIGEIGPAKTSLVAYVAPVFSVVYGVTLLDESFTAATAAGIVLILTGSWLAAEGRAPWRRRTPVSVGGEVPA